MNNIKKKEKKNLKIITINIDEKHIELIDKLLKLGVYPSRSEMFRHYLTDWIEWQFTMHDKLTDFMNEANSLLEYKKPGKNKKTDKVYILASEEIIEENGEKIRLREWNRCDTEDLKK